MSSGRKQVLNDHDDVEPARTSVKVDISDNNVKKLRAKRRRKLQTTSASEVVGQRSGLQTIISAPVHMTMTRSHARSKVKARLKRKGRSG